MRFKPGQRVQMKKVFPEKEWRLNGTASFQGRVVTINDDLLLKYGIDYNGYNIKEDAVHWYPVSCFADEVYEDGVEDILCDLE